MGKSLAEYYIGLDSFEIMIFGGILFITGFILPRGGDWISNRVTVRSLEQDYAPTESFKMTGFKEITCSCSNCGFINDVLLFFMKFFMKLPKNLFG